MRNEFWSSLICIAIGWLTLQGASYLASMRLYKMAGLVSFPATLIFFGGWVWLILIVYRKIFR